jgi:hypothetical protein
MNKKNNNKRSSDNKIKRGGTKSKLGSSRLGKKHPKPSKVKKSSPSGPNKKRAQNNTIKSRTTKPVKDGVDKTSRAKKIVTRQIQEDELLEQARSNLIAKLNAMDSKKREIIQTEQEKAQLLSALIGQNDADKSDTQRSHTINIIKPPEKTSDAEQEVECGPNIQISDDYDDVFIDSNDPGAVGFTQTALKSNSQKRKNTSDFNLENSPGLKLKSKKTMSLNGDFELEDFSTPLASDRRFSVHENPYNQEQSTELTMFDSPAARQRIKSVISKTKGVVQKYLSKLDDPSERKYIDVTKTGLQIVGNTFMLGNVEVVFNNDYLKVDDMLYPATPGVFELLLFKQPDSKIYTSADLEVYKEILKSSGAHLKYDANKRLVPSSRSLKYRNIIEPLFNKTVQGSGTIYIHWEDPNELIER